MEWASQVHEQRRRRRRRLAIINKLPADRLLIYSSDAAQEAYL